MIVSEVTNSISQEDSRYGISPWARPAGCRLAASASVEARRDYPRAAVRRAVPRHRRLGDRQCRPAIDPAQPGLLAAEPSVGGERLHPHLLRLPATRRATRRPARA